MFKYIYLNVFKLINYAHRMSHQASNINLISFNFISFHLIWDGTVCDG